MSARPEPVAIAAPATGMEVEPEWYMLGPCSIAVDRPQRANDGRWHLSIAHPERLPTWEEIKWARKRLLPLDVWLVLGFPPERYWINVHEFCLHLWETRDEWLIEQMRFEGEESRLTAR